MEFWKPIRGYEGIYEVSSFGRVRSLDRYVEGRMGMVKGHIVVALKQKTGYMRICLSKNGKKSYHSVHRLVAEAFIPNPHNYPCVNHLNEIRDCNNADNLQWCTYLENNNYGGRRVRISSSLKQSRAKPFFQMDGANRIIAIYANMSDAVKKGYDRSNIWQCLTGRKYAYLGYKWEYA